ncbi:MAG: hypothetical protein JNM07_08220 [Phycisphaerae bacterium]|nr:hypothetical protein [Phycisphaerae bacterium]
MKRIVRASAAWFVIGGICLSGSAWARQQQNAEEPKLLPPTPTASRDAQNIPLTYMLIAVILAGMVVGANLIPSKRTADDR